MCRRNLSPNGVASISYNTYPGWYLREGIRDLMRYHVGHLVDPRQKIAQAHAVLDFMVSVCDENELHGQLLKHELELIREVDESYLYHEHLEDYNQPTYFHEFIERADRHGLQYLSESNVSRMLMLDLPEKVRESLREAPHDPPGAVPRFPAQRRLSHDAVVPPRDRTGSRVAGASHGPLPRATLGPTRSRRKPIWAATSP